VICVGAALSNTDPDFQLDGRDLEENSALNILIGEREKAQSNCSRPMTSGRTGQERTDQLKFEMTAPKGIRASIKAS